MEGLEPKSNVFQLHSSNLPNSNIKLWPITIMHGFYVSLSFLS